MELQAYWGIGPKTAEQLSDTLGAEQAIEAIKAGDIRELTGAGLDRGRVTTILRRAHGEAGMDVLATRDTRSVYKELLALATAYAVTERAADELTVLTPLSERDAIENRLETVDAAVASWRGLTQARRDQLLEIFEGYDSLAGDRAAVAAAIECHETGIDGGIFEPIASLDPDALGEAHQAMGQLADGEVADGADGTLDRLRSSLETVTVLEANALDVFEEVRERGVRGEDEFRQAVIQYLDRNTDADIDTIRRAAPDEAVDSADFVSSTLRGLAEDLRAEVDAREVAVAADLESTIEATHTTVATAVEAIDDLALAVSLARFAIDCELTRPTIHDDGDTIAFAGGRNLALPAAGESVQPVTYAIGAHDLADAPAGEDVAVLTGANSGGKTTLLETACQVAVLATMGLPVPADRATVGRFDAIVFHRRHASFNAGVLESTLQTIVPPLTADGQTLMLVDEFEAITEPGSAADMLHGLVNMVVAEASIGVFVTHLAGDLEPLPEQARLDGIFAEGLNADLDLVVDYQPRFHTIGRSTPEFIVSRLVANATDPHERVGYEVLAERLGAEVAQRKLGDDWGEAADG